MDIRFRLKRDWFVSDFCAVKLNLVPLFSSANVTAPHLHKVLVNSDSAFLLTKRRVSVVVNQIGKFQLWLRSCHPKACCKAIKQESKESRRFAWICGYKPIISSLQNNYTTITVALKSRSTLSKLSAR